MLTRVATLAEPDSLPAHQPISSAMSRWPDNVELAWFAYEACSEHAGCDRLQASERLQQVDGDNVFAWLPAMNAARSAGDVDAFAIALHRAATAPVYDPRMGTVFLRLKTLFQHLPLPDSCATSPGLHDTARQSGRPLDASLLVDMEAMALEMAIAMPGLLGVTWCHQQQVALPESLIVDCRRLLERMADGDTLLEQGLALSLLIELAPNRSDRARWQERYRRLRWLYTFAAEWERIDGGAWRRFAEGEVNVLVDYAKQTGRWPPPDGWLPDDPGSRARIRGE